MRYGMNNSILEARSLGRVFSNGAKKLEVLRGVDVRVARGELLVIQGPSGAGKSTLLHVLGGLDRPTCGAVLIDGIDMYHMNDNKRAALRNTKIGFVFQFYNLLPEFSALENVIFPTLIRGKMNSGRGIQRRSLRQEGLRLLDEVGLSHRVAHKPFQLSGGELQRVAIARALINDPEIILCDEPTGNLDSKTGEGICTILTKLHKEKNKTIVIVTHEQQMARLGERKLSMQDGQLRHDARGGAH